MTEPVETSGAAPSESPPRRWPWLLVRLAVTGAALGWTLSQVSLEELLGAIRRLAPGATVVALALSFANLFVGSLRWRTLLAAYGAEQRPSILRLAHLYLVALFYNTFLPANVGGDVVRGYVTRDAFPGSAGAYLIVGIERVFGLAGLFLLGATVLLVRPLAELPHLPWLAAGALLAAAAASLAPVLARRLAPIAPSRLRTVLALTPTVRRPALLLPVLLLSVGTQSVVALTGHALVVSIAPEVTLAQSLVIVPVALIAMYLPTVAGLGTREAAFVLLFGAVGVGEADATAASLALFAVQLAVAATGGVVHLVAPPSRS